MDRATAVAEMQLGVNTTSRWLTEWRLQINASKTYAMEITRSTLPHPKPCIRLWDSNIELTNRQKHLGLVITSISTWKEHTASILQKASRILGVLHRLRCSLTKAELHKIHVCYIRPILEYASVAWGNVSRKEAEQLERFQRRAARLIPGLPLFARVNHSGLLLGAGLRTLESRRECALAILGHQLFTRKFPSHLEKVNMPKRTTIYELHRH